MSILNINVLLTVLAFTYVSLESVNAKQGFQTGPVFNDYGENIEIKDGLDKPAKQTFKVLFDVYKENDSDKPHRGLNSLARFINMHVRAGVPRENIKIALVVHGKASYDLLSETAYKTKFNKENPSHDLLSQLLKNDVKIFVCGQSSSFLEIQASEFSEGVELSLSAMTANALLQQDGYTLNPF